MSRAKVELRSPAGELLLLHGMQSREMPHVMLWRGRVFVLDGAQRRRFWSGPVTYRYRERRAMHLPEQLGGGRAVHPEVRS